jgi:hypothetical protein
LSFIQIPTTKLDLLIRSVSIASYLPGRIRLRTKHLVGNPALEIEIQAQLAKFEEISKAEEYIMSHSKRR